MSTGQRIVQAFAAGDATAMIELLGPDATFHSPVMDHRGTERLEEVLAGVVRVITEVRVTRVLEDGDATAAFFEARGAGRRAEGVLLVTSSDRSELTLMIRPLRTLLAAVERMKPLLAARVTDARELREPPPTTFARPRRPRSRAPARPGGNPSNMTCV